MPFNIYAFLLNWGYVLYRKLYITGSIGLLLTAIIITFFKSILIIYIVGTMLILGLFFNNYYIFVSKRKIEKLKGEYDGTDKFTLSNMCEERGGVNVVLALLFYFIFILFVIFSNISINYNGNHNTKYWEENSENRATCISLIKQIYNDKDMFNTNGSIQGATCKIIKTGSPEYNVYLKSKTRKGMIFSYYQTEAGNIVYKNNTTEISELENSFSYSVKKTMKYLSI